MFVKDKSKKIYHPDDENKRDAAGNPIPDSEKRFMVVRTKMTQGQLSAFWDEVNVLNRAVGGLASNAHYNMLLMAHNVTGWGGPPDEDGTPLPAFDEALIAELDPFDPLVIAVVDYLADANQRKESPDPKSATEAAGITSSDAGTTA